VCVSTDFNPWVERKSPAGESYFEQRDATLPRLRLPLRSNKFKHVRPSAFCSLGIEITALAKRRHVQHFSSDRCDSFSTFLRSFKILYQWGHTVSLTKFQSPSAEGPLETEGIMRGGNKPKAAYHTS